MEEVKIEFYATLAALVDGKEVLATESADVVWDWFESKLKQREDDLKAQHSDSIDVVQKHYKSKLKQREGEVLEELINKLEVFLISYGYGPEPDYEWITDLHVKDVVAFIQSLKSKE